MRDGCHNVTRANNVAHTALSRLETDDKRSKTRTYADLAKSSLDVAIQAVMDSMDSGEADNTRSMEHVAKVYKHLVEQGNSFNREKEQLL